MCALDVLQPVLQVLDEIFRKQTLRSDYMTPINECLGSFLHSAMLCVLYLDKEISPNTIF